MRLTYEGRHAEGVLVVIGGRREILAAPGRPVEFSEKVARSLLSQSDDWREVSTEKDKK